MPKQQHAADIALKIISQGPATLYIAEVSDDHVASFITPNIEKQLGYAPEEFTATLTSGSTIFTHMLR